MDSYPSHRSRHSPSHPLPPSHRRRSRSPQRDHARRPHRSSPHGHDSSSHPRRASDSLPFDARPLDKHDFETHKELFAVYLDVKKGLVLQELDAKEGKGRWRSFVGRWNRGELEEGWYDPATLSRATSGGRRRDSPVYDNEGDGVRVRARKGAESSDDEEEEEEEEEFGPMLPGRKAEKESGMGLYGHGRSNPRSGPAIPGVEDLMVQRESALEARNHSLDDLRYDRKADRKRQRDHLDELAPRAEPGTRERQLEKKREKADSNRAFARAKGSPGAEADVPETDLMGGGDESLEGYKRQKRDMERKKNERELRKEEVLRARVAEREERMKEFQAKEQRTVDMLKGLARERFG